jgi:hypothetical protein
MRWLMSFSFEAVGPINQNKLSFYFLSSLGKEALFFPSVLAVTTYIMFFMLYSPDFFKD